MTDNPSAVDDLELPGGSLSVIAVERQSGEPIVTSTPDRALAPASNTKLVTAGLALEHLGPDWQFETRLTGDSLDDGVVDGDIALIGSGAPDIDQAALSTLATAVTPKVERITGNLVVDGTMFPDGQVGPGWTWGDTRHYYGARSSAASLNRNQVTITITSATNDEVPSISISPDTRVVDVDSTVSVDPEASINDLQVATDPETRTITVQGAVPPDSVPVEESVPIPYPEQHAGLALRAALVDAGVELGGTVRVLTGDADESRCTETSVFARIDSAPLRDLIEEMNVPSDNFIAEQLARRVAFEVTGEGTWSAWETLVQEHFHSLGVDTVRIRDGSGLSRYNLVPARGIIAHLRWIDNQPWSDDFFDSLPTPGEGTLSSRLEGVPVAAKTGTITGTSALSGVIRREGDPDVMFSTLHGGLTQGETDLVREKQNSFVRWLAEQR